MFAGLNISGQIDEKGIWEGGDNIGLDFVNIIISKKEAQRVVNILTSFLNKQENESPN